MRVVSIPALHLVNAMVDGSKVPLNMAGVS